MPVRLRITLLFTILVFFIVGMICTGIYYFSYTSRINTVKTRLINRAITTARLLTQKEIFDRELIRRIDSSTTISLKKIIVQAYDYQNNMVYGYTERSGDQLVVPEEYLDEARVNGNYFFQQGTKEVVVYHYVDSDARMVLVTAGEDLEGKQSLATLLRILVLSMLVGLGIVLAVGYFFSAGLLVPIRRIASEVAEISAQNLTRRIPPGKTKDEWFELSTTLNDLLNRLQESFDTQRRFISNASHELSTPLTAISSQLEVSLQRQRDAEEYRKVMLSVAQDVHHMSRLTQTLLSFAKASGDPGGLEIAPIRIDEILLRLPAEMARVQADFSVQLSFDTLPENENELVVYGNEALLASAIQNIVVNACKYSTDHQAMVRLASANGQLLIAIEDRGVGMTPEALQKIFQPFYRVQENISTGGFGLGLSLAQRIIQLHKGRIQVQSTVGKGTIFQISLPVQTAGAANERLDDNRHLSGND